MKPAKFAEVILPFMLPKRTFTYRIPEEFHALVLVGGRVEVPFGKTRIYSGLVESIHENAPASDIRVREVSSVLDEVRVVTADQLRLWDWMASYYACSLGEVMHAALPAYLKLSSETSLVLNADYGEDFSRLSDKGYLIAEALLIRGEISIQDAQAILNQKTVVPVIQALLEEGVLYLKEDLVEKFNPKRVSAVRLAEPYHTNRDLLREVLETAMRTERQLECMMAFLAAEKRQPYVLKQDIVDKAVITDAVLQGLVKKGVLEMYSREVSRLGGYEEELADLPTLSPAQAEAYKQITAYFTEKNALLLQGVTGSGKTRVYIELMRKVLKEGKQVLFLLPEIALTSQMIDRLKRVFGKDIIAYHSGMDMNRRAEIWRVAQTGHSIFLGARSSLFLPFSNLGLIIVDEEHEQSFKQYDPAPRYQARDAAIVLGTICGAKVLLGTATPSVETYHNVLLGKYGLVELKERFGGLKMPEIKLVDLRKTYRDGRMSGPFSSELLDGLKLALDNGEQAILFQNRRGYAPTLLCQVCGWAAGCRNCDVSLTYHKASDRLSCHYCGYHTKTFTACPQCNSGRLTLTGLGTEKIEEELQLLLPEAKIGRMDLDTAKGKENLSRILNDFEEKRMQILVGTQMVTKGLDFENVGLVGVIQADRMLRMPDFRAAERAFQLMVQVAGRAGRKHRQGQVLIQAFDLTHPVLQEVIGHDFDTFVQRELKEREKFKYPPFFRLIGITFKHTKPEIAKRAAYLFAQEISPKIGKHRILGPTQPGISRVNTFYIQEILIKLERDRNLIAQTKELLLSTEQWLLGQPGFSTVRVGFDVDP